MRPKQAFVTLSVSLACYLIFSLTFVSAYQLGELQDTKVRFIIEPVLKIVDDLEPVNCESSGYIRFNAYVDNVPEFDITSTEAFVEDVSTGESYSVTSALSCNPKTNLISNQEIVCSLDVKEMLWNLPPCPFEKTENRFYLTLEILYGDMRVKVTGDKTFVLTEAGVEPDLEIEFGVSYPPYPVPEINCKTGSEIEVPVVIHSAETLYGDIGWTFSVNRTVYGGNLIECEKILTREGIGRENIYLCALTISNTAFTSCESGSEVLVVLRATTKDHDLSGNFSTTLSSEELNLRLKISDIPDLECQIINENGTCVPKEPQQNITATITGNVPQRLRVFETRYRLGEDEIVTTHCRKIRHNKYECMAFITIDTLPMPATKHQATIETRELTFFFDVKHMNYYTNISDSTNVTIEGKVINEILNTKKVLEKDGKFLSWIKEHIDDIQKAYEWINLMNRCCGFKDVSEELKEGKFDGILSEFAKMYLWGPADKWWEKGLSLVTQHGPGIASCIAEKGIEDINKEIKNLEDFEGGKITTKLKKPTVLELILKYSAVCGVENFWNMLKSSWKLLICLGIRFALDIFAGGLGEDICKIWNNPVLKLIRQIFSVLLIIVSVLLLNNIINHGMKSIALAREKINVEIEGTNILTEYTDALANTMETLAVGLATNTALINVTYPAYDTVKLLFISGRTGVLDNEDDICVGDEITIEYDFEKLNQSEGFVSRLWLTPNRRATPLIFDDLKGTYGPKFTDALLGTGPGDPSEMYTFTLRYIDKSLDYNLYYVNHTCI